MHTRFWNQREFSVLFVTCSLSLTGCRKAFKSYIIFAILNRSVKFRGGWLKAPYDENISWIQMMEILVNGYLRLSFFFLFRYRFVRFSPPSGGRLTLVLFLLLDDIGFSFINYSETPKAMHVVLLNQFDRIWLPWVCMWHDRYGQRKQAEKIGCRLKRPITLTRKTERKSSMYVAIERQQQQQQHQPKYNQIGNSTENISHAM